MVTFSELEKQKLDRQEGSNAVKGILRLATQNGAVCLNIEGQDPGLYYYSLAQAPVEQLPLQIPYAGDTTSYYIPMNSEVNLVVWDIHAERQVTIFDPPLTLYSKVSALDIVTGQLLDMLLPDLIFRFLSGSTTDVANRLRKREPDFLSSEFIQALIERWTLFFETGTGLQEKFPQRREWLRTTYGLAIGSKPLDEQAEEAGDAGDWRLLETVFADFPAADDPADPMPEVKGVLIGAHVTELIAIDPVKVCKRNHVR